MYQVIEKDWKLFRKLLPGWQEAYMERLTMEYIELLSSDRQASDKFWELDAFQYVSAYHQFDL